MKNTSATLRWSALACALALGGCVTPGGGTVSTGTSPTAVTGGAAGGTSAGANPSLERCAAPLGTLAVDDGRGKDWYASFGAATQVTSIEPLLRVAVQQSNCFVITAIGNSRTDSRLTAITDKQRNSGEFRAGSQQQKGQRVAADYCRSRPSSSTTTPRAGWPGPWAACSAAARASSAALWRARPRS
jgi:hypothetical protein